MVINEEGANSARTDFLSDEGGRWREENSPINEVTVAVIARVCVRRKHRPGREGTGREGFRYIKLAGQKPLGPPHWRPSRPSTRAATSAAAAAAEKRHKFRPRCEGGSSIALYDYRPALITAKSADPIRCKISPHSH